MFFLPPVVPLTMHRIQRERPLRLEALERRWLLAADVASLTDVAEGEGELVADFSLIDVNPTSTTYNQAVSPRDYLGQVSGWYFGHAT